MIRIIIAEDDYALCSLVRTYLEASGYEVAACRDGAEALEKIAGEKFDMLITDIMMPNMDGFELAREVRSFDENIPIIFMTARDDKISKQLGYKTGIDDYITKPFDIDELVMCVQAILRRVNINAQKTLTAGNLTMDTEEHTAYADGKELPLTVREFDILFKLLSSPKKTFTRSQLMNDLWDYDSSATSRTVDVTMAKLREKTAVCDGFEIVTMRGLGYKAVLK